jgi:hypothetical protein
MKIVFLLIFIFTIGSSIFTSKAHADINGQWQGWGEWNYEGSGTHCYDVRFIFKENEKQIDRQFGRFNCDFVSLDVPPLVIQKENNKLLIDGKQIGSFDENSYQWTEDYSTQVKINVSIHREAKHLDYSELWYDSKNILLYDIKSRVFLHQGDNF